MDESRTDWSKLYDEFESLSEGAWISGKNGEVYVKPSQSRDHHLEGMVVSLVTGKLKHFSMIMGGENHG